MDLLNFRHLELALRVRVPANNGVEVELQHSAVNEDDCFDVVGNAMGITSGDDENQTQTYTNFLRYVRLKTIGTVTTQPTLTAVLIAKGI